MALPTAQSTAEPTGRWGTVAEAATHARLSETTIRRWLREGRLTKHRFGPKLLRIDLDQLDAQLRKEPPMKEKSA